MILLEDKKRCTGCGACVNKCALFAIYMKSDEEGFQYPVIKEEICINCGACKAVCPIGKEENAGVRKGYLHTYASVNLNLVQRLGSSSGGIFHQLAEYVLIRGGIVFGAAFSDDFTKVKHTHIDIIDDIPKLRGSKYVQSDIRQEFQKVKENLEKGRWTLFAGTACQISGLKSYLSKDYETLICIDFFCRGIPSPKIWEKYIQTYFRKEKIESINFKDKVLGWKQFCVSIKTKERNYIENGFENLFMQGYFRGLYSRPACHQCSHKGVERESDFTLADFWGIENVFPDLDDNKGVSCIITHSEKAERILSELTCKLKLMETDVDAALRKNPYACTSEAINRKREKFWNYEPYLPFRMLMLLFCCPLKLRLKNRLKRIVGQERISKIKNRERRKIDSKKNK